MTGDPRTALELADWRRRVNELYARVRANSDPVAGHADWRAGRDALFRDHPQSPLVADDPLRASGLPYFAYDPALRFELPLEKADAPTHLSIPTGGDEVTEMDLLGFVALPAPFDATVDVWSMAQYGGGLFLPLRDGTSGKPAADGSSYGGGRYLLDTAKGADLGGAAQRIIIDLNFLYHPSCRYNPEWVCPLAQRGNTIAAAVRAGEML